VDNITHSLVGVALADLSMGRRATKAQRPLFIGAGIIAANLPDLDLAYSRITAPPLGYLLHHRGHTHTVAGLVALACVLVLTYWCFPSVRKMRLSGRVRFWLLIALALASHLALDSLNSYGVHPFYPVDNTWYFGDSVFILEPSLWLILGLAVALNGRSRTARLAVAMPMLVLLATTASTGAIPLDVVGALAIGGAVFAWVSLRWSPSTRAAAALVVLVLIAAGFGATSRLARSAALDALTPGLRGQMVDVILTPNPSSPLCWAVIGIELRENEGVYVLWRGTLSLRPAWRRPTDCASYQLGRTRDARIVGNGRLALRDTRHEPLERLRTLAEGDCRVRAWLRFGRAPVIEGGSLFDLRFADRIGQEFSHMRLGPREGCPANVPVWSMPRADLLRR
jgi:inner membrane protein